MNILVVEDEPAVRDSVRRALELKGYRVETAVDGPKALIAARGTERDAIVLDVMLPGLDGLEVCRRLRGDGNTVPILMLSPTGSVRSWRARTTSARRGGTAMRVEESVEINRPLNEVFNYVSDARNYPHWMAHALEVRTDAPRPPRQGDTFMLAIKSVGRRFETLYERTSCDSDRRFTDQALGGPIPDHRWHSAFEEMPNGTHFTRTVEVESSGLLKLLEPLQKWSAERQLRKDLQTLKDVVEGSPDAEPSRRAKTS
jgi:CheY-like chemotaxis protein/ligand-binding SRPBCC domain-containing protein